MNPTSLSWSCHHEVGMVVSALAHSRLSSTYRNSTLEDGQKGLVLLFLVLDVFPCKIARIECQRLSACTTLHV